MRGPRDVLWILALSVCFLVAAHPSYANPADFSAGFVNVTLTDPVEDGPMTAIFAYPTMQPPSRTALGPYTIEATRNATPTIGRFPLIVVSHGTGGSALGHHDSLTALAGAGFIAAAVEHPRDNYRDQSGFGTDLQLIGRPHHIVALIDAVLADPNLGPLVDRERIGMAGFSAGGYTTLLIIGARPDFTLREAYRRAEPDDPMNARADAADPKRRRKPGLELVSDPRVRAAFIMAPALGFVFDRAGLADIRVPVRLYRAGADEVLRHPWNAERIRQMLPSPPEYEVLEGAGHYVFLAPCPAALAAELPEICRDPPGIDRAAIHARLNAEMVDFFRRTLGPG